MAIRELFQQPLSQLSSVNKKNSFDHAALYTFIYHSMIQLNYAPVCKTDSAKSLFCIHPKIFISHMIFAGMLDSELVFVLM